MEKTSKVKSIGEIRERTPDGGKTVFYHSLEMENWDKISLGKQKKWAFSVWQEITYYQDWTDKVGNPKWKEKRKPWKWWTWVTNTQIAFLGACILSTSHPDKKLGELVDLLKKEIEKYS